MLSWVLVLCVATGAAAFAESGLPFAFEARQVYRLEVRSDAAGRDWLSARGFDIAGQTLADGWVEVITDEKGLARLRAEGFALEILEEERRPVSLAQAMTGSEPGRAPTDPLTDTAYADNGEILAFLQQVAADHPSIVRLEEIGTSLQGHSIQALMISDNAAQDEDELSVLFNAGHHAREVMTAEVIMDIIDQLTDNYGVDPEITAIVDSYQIWCVPMVNPDGLEIVFAVDHLWRKNARDNDANLKINWKDGVDPNRNYEWGWGGQCQGSSSTTSAATYRGTAEATEPETRAMIQLGRRIRPVIYVEYHSYGEDVFYAMGCDPDAFSPTLNTILGPDQSISRVVAEEYASRIVQADGDLGFTAAPFGYRVDGVGRDHHSHENGSIALVTEINSAVEGGFQPDYATWRDATVEGQRPGWLWLLNRISGSAIGGHVTDAVTGLPVVADLALAELSLPDGRRVTSSPGTGRYHIIVVPGSYTLGASAPGYESLVGPVSVGGSAITADLALQPTGATRLGHEDFEEPAGWAAWTLGEPADTATAGIWELGEPKNTQLGDVQSANLMFGNPQLDRTPGTGSHAAVTGNTPGVDISDDDVDEGSTRLTSPSYDLDGWYAVEVGWQLWLRNDPPDSLDGLEVEVSDDGGAGWVSLGTWQDSTAGTDAPYSWVPVGARLDDVVRPGPDIRFRFTATDDGADNLVEVAIDDLEIHGFSIASQGAVAGLRFTGPGAASLTWESVPGAPDAVYEIVRGELASLSGDADGVDLGPLTCLEPAAAGTSFPLDPGAPPPGTGWFYLARFKLGFSVGGWGEGSDGGPRTGLNGCAP